MAKASSRLGKQFEEVIATLDKVGARFALIGGLALAAHKVVRATQGVDLLIDADLANAVDQALTALGCRCQHRNADAANYLRGDQRFDLLYAHRPTARQLLQAASQLTTPFGDVHVVSAEGLIAFKLQGWVNNPRRTQDLEDIRSLIRANLNSLNMAEVRGYFRLFSREPFLRRFSVRSSDVALHPLSSDGGMNSPPPDIRDPFEALDDLMQVIEALCSTWPGRELLEDTELFKL